MVDWEVGGGHFGGEGLVEVMGWDWCRRCWEVDGVAID